VADVLTRPVRALVTATPTTRILRLDLGDAPFVFKAGQAALLGAHGLPQPHRRPYSIASSPEDAKRYGRLEFLLKVEATGDPGFHLPNLHVGMKVDLEGPFGAFTLPEASDATGFLFVGGGTGIAPLRSMWRHLIACGETRPMSVLYSARTPDEFAYGAELRRLARQRGDYFKLICTVTGEASEWSGGRGRIGIAQLQAALPSGDALAFICGPPSLVEDVPPLLLKLGASAARIRIEEW
jgi:ferredoxin-NADP reductase